MDDFQTINVLKGLVIDAVAKAKSGHPGGAMSSLDFAYLLFTEFLAFDPDDARWLGRDRFVLSPGHESMLLYTLLDFIGWLDSDELKHFRQLHSKTPGHPENFLTPGVEATTGPLGQGAAMSVGMALGGTHLAASLDPSLFGYHVYALVSDGDLQEDVALGAAALAGHLRLGNLTWFYDKNNVQLSGPLAKAASTDFVKVFEGYGWRVLTINGHDHAAIRDALKKAKTEKTRPVLIIGETTIAKGAATMEGSYKTHGEPLPAEERVATKKKLGLPVDTEFYRPAEAVTHFRRRFDELRRSAAAWRERLAQKTASDPAFAKGFARHFKGFDASQLTHLSWPADKPIATRNAFGDVLAKWGEELPLLIGGSADLEPSNMTGPFAKKVGEFTAENRVGRSISFGVREFAMSAICNGIALGGGLIPFDATFLTFSDYSRGALRLGAIQRCRVLHEFTHDSFYLGEDGPTHQPIEQLMSLRMIPDFYLMRPADAYETEVMMRHALTLQAPSAICLSRQKLPLLNIDAAHYKNAVRGAYVVFESKRGSKPLDLLIMATGSEVTLALEAAAKLSDLQVRVVSMPCWELFLEEPLSYRDEVLPPSCRKRVSIEAGTTLGWQKFTGDNGLTIGVDHFGQSAPAEVLAEAFGFTVNSVVARIRNHHF